MASVKTSKVNPKYKRKYRVRNWAAYERGLRDRGDVTVWLSEEAIDLDAPDHTTLSRRNQTVELPSFSRVHTGPIHLIVDSTGLKIFGAGEWNARKHRKAKDRGGWRKLHIGVDGDGFIVAEALTENTKDDAAVLPELLGQIDGRIRRFTGDGAYDRKSVYDQIGTAGTEDVAIIVPPRRAAAL
jgi:hypothetical protein